MADTVTYLTEEERDYLRQLFAESVRREQKPLGGEHTLLLESPSIERDLLLRMLAEMHAEMIATDGQYCLRFRLELAPSPYGGPAVLRLAPPTVIDRHGIERGVRVRPVRGEIALHDRGGRLAQSQVLDISDSGVAIVPPAPIDARPGTRMADLQLKLPGRQPFSVTGRVVRVEPARSQTQRLALAFEDVPPEAQSALRRYVFDHYELTA